MKKTLVVVLGAGASHDCGVPDIAKMPLSNGLFDARYNNFLLNFPQVNSIADRIRAKVRAGKNLEEVLLTYKSSSNQRDVLKAQQVILYLEYLIRSLSEHNASGISNTYHSFINELDTSDYTEVLILTLNFDTLFERAFMDSTGHDFNKFQILAEEIPQFGKFHFTKLHGSIGWVQKVKNFSVFKHQLDRNIQNNLDKLDKEVEVDPDIVRVSSYGRNCVIDDSFYFPAIAIPLEGKLSFVCPQNHVKQAQEIINNSSDFLFIGFSGKDPHLIDLFKNVKSVSKLRVICGAYDDEENASAFYLLKLLKEGSVAFNGFVETEKQRIRQLLSDRHIFNEEHLPYPESKTAFNGGFREFVDDKLEDFIKE